MVLPLNLLSICGILCCRFCNVILRTACMTRYMLMCSDTYDSTPIESSLSRMQITTSMIFDEVMGK